MIRKKTAREKLNALEKSYFLKTIKQYSLQLTSYLQPLPKTDTSKGETKILYTFIKNTTILFILLLDQKVSLILYIFLLPYLRLVSSQQLKHRSL